MAKTPTQSRLGTRIKVTAILAQVEPSNLAHAIYDRLPITLKRLVKRNYSNLKRLVAKIAAPRIVLNSPTFNLNNFGIGDKGKVSVILIPVHSCKRTTTLSSSSWTMGRSCKMRLSEKQLTFCGMMRDWKLYSRRKG